MIGQLATILSYPLIGPETEYCGQVSCDWLRAMLTSDWLQADLPCDITSGAATHSAGDSVYLVLWYRKDSGTPIYR